ncbi:hypothetical protein NDN08_003177 [Rhodosorus marinus]|uniref:Zinc finger PHD-type domain-containing protein n=1 Tax=Rhodosorus marinus TaxID=101924 RepID=A0AAV8V0C1_9RHOD|nr:hypothetical protein NDN08_003177 [Rhodosorus marinus]
MSLPAFQFGKDERSKIRNKFLALLEECYHYGKSAALYAHGSVVHDGNDVVVEKKVSREKQAANHSTEQNRPESSLADSEETPARILRKRPPPDTPEKRTKPARQEKSRNSERKRVRTNPQATTLEPLERLPAKEQKDVKRENVPTRKLVPTQKSKYCALCPKAIRSTEEDSLAGPYRTRPSRRDSKDFYMHEDCCRWSPYVYKSRSGQMAGLVIAYLRSRDTVCKHCGELHAGVQCLESTCDRIYHYRCLEPAGCVVYEQSMKMHCPEHGKGKKNSESASAKQDSRPRAPRSVNRSGEETEVDRASIKTGVWEAEEEELFVYAKPYHRSGTKSSSHIFKGKDTRVFYSVKRKKVITELEEFSLREWVTPSTDSACRFIGEKRPHPKKGYLLLLRVLRSSWLLFKLPKNKNTFASDRRLTHEGKGRQTRGMLESKESHARVKEEPQYELSSARNSALGHAHHEIEPAPASPSGNDKVGMFGQKTRTSDRAMRASTTSQNGLPDKEKLRRCERCQSPIAPARGESKLCSRCDPKSSKTTIVQQRAAGQGLAEGVTDPTARGTKSLDEIFPSFDQ